MTNRLLLYVLNFEFLALARVEQIQIIIKSLLNIIICVK